MRTNLVLTVLAIVLAAIFMPSAEAMAQPNVPTLTVDTLTNLGKFVPGEASGALFLPDGNIIAIWNGRPLIIDSKSGEVIRNLDALSSGGASELEITNDGTKLVTKITGPKLAIWDVPSGKIIFQLDKQISYFCLSPDGTKLYVTLRKQDNIPGIIVIYDMNTFEEIERLSYDQLIWGGSIDISSDGQTLAVSVEKKQNGSSDKQTNQVILINLNDKENYMVVEPAGSGFLSMQFSPDGKRITSLYNDGNHIYIYIYDLETKEKKYIRSEELSTLFGGAYVAAIGKPQFIDANTIYTGFTNLSGSVNYTFTWDIQKSFLKNYINFDPSMLDVNDSLILFCGGRYIGLANKLAVAIKDLEAPRENYITYQDNQLEFNVDKAFIGESIIYDTTGKQIANLGTKAFLVGRNTIQVNQTLHIGVYLLTIKSGTNQLSFKFLVE